eukprot:1158294-Pelagomonas_calceolata.AAC.7
MVEDYNQKNAKGKRSWMDGNQELQQQQQQQQPDSRQNHMAPAMRTLGMRMYAFSCPIHKIGPRPSTLGLSSKLPNTSLGLW